MVWQQLYVTRRLAEYLLGPVTLQVMVLPHLKNDEQIDEILFSHAYYDVRFTNSYSEQIMRVT